MFATEQMPSVDRERASEMPENLLCFGTSANPGENPAARRPTPLNV
jgi:hypothetical protein